MDTTHRNFVYNHVQLIVAGKSFQIYVQVMAFLIHPDSSLSWKNLLLDMERTQAKRCCKWMGQREL